MSSWSLHSWTYILLYFKYLQNILLSNAKTIFSHKQIFSIIYQPASVHNWKLLIIEYLYGELKSKWKEIVLLQTKYYSNLSLASLVYWLLYHFDEKLTFHWTFISLKASLKPNGTLVLFFRFLYIKLLFVVKVIN